MHVEIHHTTTYRYDPPPTAGLMQVRLTPRQRDNQRIVEWDRDLDGADHQVSYIDQHGNAVDLLSTRPDAAGFTLIVRGVVDVTDAAGVVGAHRGLAPLWLYRRHTDLSMPGERVEALLGGVDGSAPGLAQLHQLAELVRSAVRYETGSTNVATAAEDALAVGSGVCQDHAHVFLAAARSLGFPARYVSGYLVMMDTVDQSATHAWAEAFVEDLGWVGFDVANGVAADDRYVVAAIGLDYREAAPLSGLFQGDTVEHLSVELQVQQ